MTLFPPLQRLAASAALAVILGTAPTAARATTPVTSPHGSLKAECSHCHGAKGWAPAQVSKSFDHAAYGFALEGAHRAADCKACHQSLEFARAATDCASCHLDPHRGELGVTCEQCHTPRSFLDRAAMTRRHQETRFPLMGAHLAADCAHCHEPQQAGGLQFVALPSLCQSCHLSEYQTTSNPDHAGSGFSLQCELCHRPVRWDTASFNHAASGFPLTGAHRTAACASCHVGGVYAGTSTTCVSCHQADYDGAANPSHIAAAFPVKCASCHSTSSWNGSLLEHDPRYFPIYSGAHRGRWSLCSDCHTQPSNFVAFSCIGCHPHSDKNATDGKHTGTAGYEYLSTACYACHPQGRH